MIAATEESIDVLEAAEVAPALAHKSFAKLYAKCVPWIYLSFGINDDCEAARLAVALGAVPHAR